MKRISALVVGLGLVVAACGGLTSQDREVLARVEGRWMCDVQRYTFEDVADIEAELAARVVAAGYDLADYETFKAVLGEDPELRAQVRGVYEEYCA